MSSLFIHNTSLLSFHDGFINGNDSLFAENGIIKAIGKYDELKPLIQSNTNIIDAAGKTLMPGFNDTHIHIWKVGNLKTYMLDVRGVQSKEDLLDALSDYNNKYPDVAWITARGFNEAAWSEAVIPTKDDLDKVSSSKPIYVIRTCAHIAVSNSLAMQIAGITKDTVVPPGGEIRLNNDGQPNGIFTETALGLITKHIPAPSKAELKTMVRATREEMYSYGITAATDPAVHPELLEAYYEMNADGELGFRLNALPIIIPDGGEKPYPIPEYFSSDFFNVNTVKFFSDGGLSGKTAALKRFYKNSHEQGVLRLNADQYESLCRQSMNKGLAIATHAIGDAAIEFVINIYERLHKDFPGISNRIEHLGLPEKKHLQQMADNNIAASMQTIFLYELGKNFIAALDDDYLNQCYPVASAMQAGIKTALSSDAPVVKDFNPVAGIEAAVTRRTNDHNIIAPHEVISVADACKAYTHTAAEISNIKNVGSLQEGKKADFILLNKNPLTLQVSEINSLHVEKTFVDGNCVWQSKSDTV